MAEFLRRIILNWKSEEIGIKVSIQFKWFGMMINLHVL
jgi:hypothetical protein